MERWRCITGENGSAAWNMAVDETLLEGVGETGVPVLRLYRWETSLSFGRFSKPHRCLDLDRLREREVPCVRRPSGGGVLVHGGDLSYAIIFPRDRLRGKGARENYRDLCRFLFRLYATLGVEGRFAGGEKGEGSGVCLAGREPEDILIGGKKMGGNAQRYTSRGLLQHGTIPLFVDRVFFEPLFVEASGLGEAATLEKLGIRTSFETLSNMAAESFCETFQAALDPEPLSPGETRRSKELAEYKYSDERWTFDGRETMA